MSKKSHKKSGAEDNTIAINRKARHDYFIEEQIEAGLVLEGWEVKSIRDGRIQLAESYIILKNNAAWLLGAHISPLKTASTHIHPVPDRTRKLLLHQKELDRLFGSVERKGFTVVPLNMHWKKNRVKISIALAKGKKTHDKRASIKDREWQRDKARIMKERN